MTMTDDDELTRSEFAQALCPELDNSQRQRLKGLGQDLDPVVLVGDRGISDNLIENFENQLLAHELIKVKVHDNNMIRPVARQLHEATDAQLIQSIGNALLFYKAHPEEPELLH
jgi:RNA-binding protein